MNNDVLRSVRYMLNVNDTKITEIIKLADFDVNNADVVNFLKKKMKLVIRIALIW